jgi:hypothetical protein
MNTDDMSKEELVDAVEQLTDQVEELSERVETLEGQIEYKRGEDIQNLWIAGEPVGKVAYNNRERSKRNATEISEIANGDVSNSGHENRGDLLPLHSMWIDVRDGADDRISNASVRRAAILFHEILRQAQDGSRSSVGVTRERFIVTAPDAKQPILEHDEAVDKLSSQQVKRAFSQAQMLSGRDCDCDDVKRCEHGMLVARFDGGTNKLTADREAVLNYLRGLDDSPTEAGDTTDDPAEPGEDAVETDEAAAELDAITSAQSNAGVSSSEATALEREAAPDGGTQPR